MGFKKITKPLLAGADSEMFEHAVDALRNGVVEIRADVILHYLPDVDPVVLQTMRDLLSLKMQEAVEEFNEFAVKSKFPG